MTRRSLLITTTALTALLAFSAQAGTNNAVNIQQTAYTNNGDVTQTGSDNKETLIQTGVGNGSIGIQTGSANAVNIQQTGDTNRGDSVNIGRANETNVLQNGVNNWVQSSFTGDKNIVNINEQGRNHTTTVEGFGNNNRFTSQATNGALGTDGARIIGRYGKNTDGNAATVNVVGASETSYVAADGATRNTARIDVQGTGILAQKNVVQAIQAGDGSDMHVAVQAYNNRVVDRQSGAKNYSNVVVNSAFNNATIDQIGTGNVSGLLQEAGPTNVSYVGQVGNGNNSNISQTGNNNRADTGQTGNGNDAAIAQIGTTHWAQTIQTGSNNVASLTQFMHDTSATAEAYGNSNTASFFQYGTNLHAEDRVYGNNNGTTVWQSWDPGHTTMSNKTVGSGNQAEIRQWGPNNLSQTFITGDNNSVRVRQGEIAANVAGFNNQLLANVNGNGNRVDVFQYEHDNKANVAVNGNGNAVSIDSHQLYGGLAPNVTVNMQAGSVNNTAQITTHGGSTVYYTTLPGATGNKAIMGVGNFGNPGIGNGVEVTQGGSGNTLDLFTGNFSNFIRSVQTGSGNYSKINTPSNNNTLQVFQTGTNNYSDVTQEGSHNNALVDIAGSRNHVHMYQWFLPGGGDGADSTVVVRDGATDNYIDTQEYGGVATWNIISPNSHFNRQEMYVAGDGLDAHVNVASIQQTGDRNFAHMEVGDQNNTATLLQQGNDNSAFVKIAGVGHFNGFKIEQLGNNHKLIANHPGGSIPITIIQQ